VKSEECFLPVACSLLFSVQFLTGIRQKEIEKKIKKRKEKSEVSNWQLFLLFIINK
jgi:hypothetical protein